MAGTFLPAKVPTGNFYDTNGVKRQFGLFQRKPREPGSCFGPRVGVMEMEARVSVVSI